MKFAPTAALRSPVTEHAARATRSRPRRRFGISLAAWRKLQRRELQYWSEDFAAEVPFAEPPQVYYRRQRQAASARLFRNLRLNISGLSAADIGCGPFGSLPFQQPGVLLGVDTLAREYQAQYPYRGPMLILQGQAERLAFLDNALDAVYCVNALDRFAQPYDALRELIRVLRPGGYLALAVALGRTPADGCDLLPDDLGIALERHFRPVELRSSAAAPEGWFSGPGGAVFVFQGEKIARR